MSPTKEDSKIFRYKVKEIRRYGHNKHDKLIIEKTDFFVSITDFLLYSNFVD